MFFARFFHLGISLLTLSLPLLGLPPDPKCKLNISSFLTVPHPSDYLICVRDIMITDCVVTASD